MAIGDPVSLVLDLVDCEHFAHYSEGDGYVVYGVEVLVFGEYG